MNKEDLNNKAYQNEESEDTFYPSQEVQETTGQETTEQEVTDDEEYTVFAEQDGETPQPEPADDETDEDDDAEVIEHMSVEAPAEKPKTARWKKMTIGGVTGIGLGIVTAHALQPNEPEPEPQPEPEPYPEPRPQPEPQPEPVEGMHVATSVDDNMTFGQAFAHARAEVGPGGMFEFEGELYSTFTEEEWDAMSPAQKNSFNEQVNAHIRANHHPDGMTPAQPQPVAAQENGISFEIVNVGYSEELGATVAQATLADGTAAVFLDTPNTPYVEIMGIDVNHDGKIEGNELGSIVDNQITMDGLLNNTPFAGSEAPYPDETTPMTEV